MELLSLCLSVSLPLCLSVSLSLCLSVSRSRFPKANTLACDVARRSDEAEVTFVKRCSVSEYCTHVVTCVMRMK